MLGQSRLSIRTHVDAYCKANNIDITPEADSGGGPVDFKFSANYETRVLIELKLATSSKVVTGYTTQLEVYKKAEETTWAIYLVMDVGSMGTKDKRLLALKNADVARKELVSEVTFIDASPKKSASQR